MDWLDVQEAACHARCGKGSIYLAVRQGKLCAAHLGGRRELRFLASWIDEWLLSTSTPKIKNLGRSGDEVDGDRLHSSTD
ncbi:MAG: helix-turn-helix domain-containing protein [Vicinamibacterales bacterium]|nr:helix-turn-helix domain-containing protein [Vicinamibacterales bacterium]